MPPRVLFESDSRTKLRRETCGGRQQPTTLPAWGHERAGHVAGVDVGVYQTLLDRGELKTRIYAVWPLPGWDRLARTGYALISEARCCGRGLKGLPMESRIDDGTLLQPYLDAPNTAEFQRRDVSRSQCSSVSAAPIERDCRY